MAVKPEQRPTTVTAGRVFAWIFGVFFLFGGIGSIAEGLLFAIPVILAGVLLLPPVRAFVAQRWKIELSMGLLIIAVVVLLGISAMNMPKYELPPVSAASPAESELAETKSPATGARVRRASIVLERVQVSSANLYPLRVTVQNTGDVAITPKFDVTVTDTAGAEVCSGSPLVDEFSTVAAGQSRTGEFSILSCLFTQDGTYTVSVDLLDRDYAKLSSDTKDVTVTYWSAFS